MRGLIRRQSIGIYIIILILCIVCIISARDLNFSSRRDSKSIKYNNNGIPVLMYHSIKNDKTNPLVVQPEVFKDQMKYLKDNGYTTLSMSELFNFMKYNKEVPQKSVVITFDDGYEDNFINAYPILRHYNLKATIFIITDLCNQGGLYIKFPQLKEMINNGIEIGSHTLDHSKLNKLTYDEQLYNLKQSKKIIDEKLGINCKYLSYPYGEYNKVTINALKEAGYKMAFTTKGKWAYKSNGIFTLNRIYIGGLLTMNEFKQRVTNPTYLDLTWFLH
ncbi:MAG: polysaccharide deacetylase [Clostridiaceae bacterium]|jgi:peptidoglycan/xylan/chitin deacetylase (PgdA/CDA1 family)|nr:polysaccharide deacetylase [Clostridiaceae bacterium]